MSQTKAQLLDGKSATIQYTAGSASAPAISFTSDTNTGIYSPGTDEVAISTNGTGRLFVAADGKVGIAGAPSNPLDVFGSVTLGIRYKSSGSYGGIVADNTSSTGGGYFAAHQNGSQKAAFGVTGGFIGDTSGDAGLFAETGQAIRFFTNGSVTEKARITSDGKLGLGSSSPNAPLMVQGSSQPVIRAYTTDTGTSNQILFDNGSNYHYGTIGTVTGNSTTTGDVFGLGYTAVNTTDFTPVLSWTANTGRVGVGTTSPTSPLGFASSTGQKIDLFSGTPGNEFGFGVESSELRVCSGGGSFIGFRTGGYSGSERARITSSGQLLVGTSASRSDLVGLSPQIQVEASSESQSASTVSVTRNSNDNGGSAILLAKSRGAAAGAVTIVQNNDILGGVYFMGADGTNVEIGAQITGEVDGTPGNNDLPSRLVFSVTRDGQASPTEALRVTNGGETRIFCVTAAQGLIINHSDTARNVYAFYEGRYSATDNSGGTGTRSYIVYTSGDVRNVNNSYGAISDLKLKENIIDANSQWDDLKALKVRNYNLKEGQTHTQIGLVAQEVELVSPGLVTESPDRDEDGNDLGTVTKSVNYSVLYMKAVKALQEAMERIEVLEQRLTDAGIA